MGEVPLYAKTVSPGSAPHTMCFMGMDPGDSYHWCICGDIRTVYRNSIL